MSKKLLPVIAISILSTGIIHNEYKENQNYKITRQLMQSEYSPDNIMKLNIDKYKMDKQIEQKQQEIANYLGSDEYAKREKIKELELQTGLDIRDYKKVDMKCSYYSSLPEENGGYEGLTYKGEDLEFGMVANNRYPLNTKILVGDTLKTVKDIGAESHFGNYERLDIFVPRNPGESDSEYLKRVNNYGRNTVESYVLELEES